MPRPCACGGLAQRASRPPRLRSDARIRTPRTSAPTPKGSSQALGPVKGSAGPTVVVGSSVDGGPVVGGGSVGGGPANTGSRSNGAGLLSQAMPSPPAWSLPSAGPGWASRPSGSDGSLRRCACAAACEGKSEQFWSFACAHAGDARAATATTATMRIILRTPSPFSRLRVGPSVLRDSTAGAALGEPTALLMGRATRERRSVRVGRKLVKTTYETTRASARLGVPRGAPDDVIEAQRHSYAATLSDNQGRFRLPPKAARTAGSPRTRTGNRAKRTARRGRSTPPRGAVGLHSYNDALQEVGTLGCIP